MTHGDPTLLFGVTFLAAFFGSLSLIAWSVRKLWLAHKRRKAVRAFEEWARQREALMRTAPPRVITVPASHTRMIREELERRERRGPRPTSERVNELDAVDPLVTSLLVSSVLSSFGGPTNSLPEKFEGKGGTSGGAGASDDWLPEPPKATDPIEPERADAVIESQETETDTSTDTTESSTSE